MCVLKRSVWCLSEDGWFLWPLHLAHSHHLWHQRSLHTFWWVSMFTAVRVTIPAPAKQHLGFSHSFIPSLLAWSSGCHPGCSAILGDLLGSSTSSVRPVVGAGRGCQGCAAAGLPSASYVFCRHSHLLWYFWVSMWDPVIASFCVCDIWASSCSVVTFD